MGTPSKAKNLPQVDFKNAPGQSLLNVGLYGLETVGNAYGGTAVAGLGARAGSSFAGLVNGWRTWGTSSGGVTAINGITENAIAEVTIHAQSTVARSSASNAVAGTALELAAATAESGGNEVIANASQKGLTMLGHITDGYSVTAKSIGAKFHYPQKYWTQEGNFKFLERIVQRGDNVLLSRPYNMIRPDSFLLTEVKYLLENGYKLSADGLRLFIP